MLEFVALMMFLMAAFIVFQKYIVRGFTGRWKGIGDAIGQGRIFSPNRTIECAANTFFIGVPEVWYNQTCFEANCEPACLRSGRNSADCSDCITSCQTPYCL